MSKEKSFSKDAEKFRALLRMAIPYVKKSGASFEEIKHILNFDDKEFELIEEGGDNSEGIIDLLDGGCPCQHEYTVNTVQTNTGQNLPTVAQKTDCLANPPPVEKTEWDCPDDCVQVLTHIWHGYVILKVTELKTGNFYYLFNCNRFGQYHCKKPDDPAVDAPPKEGPPSPT